MDFVCLGDGPQHEDPKIHGEPRKSHQPKAPPEPKTPHAPKRHLIGAPHSDLDCVFTDFYPIYHSDKIDDVIIGLSPKGGTY